MSAPSLRRTILVFLAAFVIGLCTVTFIPVYFTQQASLRAEFLARGKALAKNLANNSRAFLEKGEEQPLVALVDSLMKEPDIRWVAIRDPSGRWVAQNGVGSLRLDAGEADPGERIETVRIRRQDLERGETVLDIQVDCRQRGSVSAAVGGVAELELFGSEEVVAGSKGPAQERTLGTVHLGLSLKGLQAKQRTITLQMVLILLAALALALGVGLVFSNSFLQPIAQLGTFMEAIASSRGDLTRRIELDRDDELGRLAVSFNRFIENIRQIVLHTESLITQMSAALEEISATAQQLNASANTINDNVQSFTRDLQQQEAETTQTTSTITRVVETLLSVTRQSEDANRIFAETEEVSRQGRETVQDSVTKITGISESMRLIDQRMRDLAGSLAAIGDFIETIRGISSQTNLLSLNAAIEAARAGESGRGFSVVAEEVRKLAENASTASRQVQAIIQKIQNETRATSEATRQGTAFVQEGTAAVYQAGNALERILQKADQAAGLSVEVGTAMREQTDILRAMQTRVQSVQTLGRSNFNAAQRMAASVGEQAASLDAITTSIQRLGESATQVRQMIVEFKVE